MENLLAAAIKYTPMSQIPFMDNWTTGDVTVVEFINGLYLLSIVIGASLAVLMLAYHGLRLISARDNPSVRTKASQRMFDAIIGVIALLVMTGFFNIINPQITSLKINDTPLQDLSQ